MFNVVNPDMIIEKFGADTLRLYEMFLGPVEQSKPWDTNGIDGCYRFLKKFWNFFVGQDGKLIATDNDPSKEELKALHTLIKKVTTDIEEFSYNTSIAAFMICVNELVKLKSVSRKIKEQLTVLIAPFCPHLAEELWEMLGHKTSVCDAAWPELNEQYLKVDTETLGISFNGKTRFTMDFAPEATKEEIEQAVLAAEESKKHLEGKQIVKIIVVPHRIVNIVLK